MKSLAQRSITSVSWSALASAISVAVLFVRAVVLARLLPVEVFGIYVGAGAIVAVTVIAPRFGMGSAFLHRAPETRDEEKAARIHFTLKLLFTLAWCLLMVTGTLVLADGPTRTALLLLIATTAGTQLTETPRLILIRGVVHRRLALIQVLGAIITTLVAVTLAWQGATLWALLAADITALAVLVVGLYLWRPVWRPRLAWSPVLVRYYLRFGARAFVAEALQAMLDRLDDLWVRFSLGVVPLGLYSRAYAFAAYPRRILAAPVAAVIGGTYAELKGDRQRLSKAFFRANALMVRAGFLLAGLLALVAPELIRFVLGEKWLPMLLPFRLMLIFTMLDPIRSTVGNIFAAVGRPGVIVRARAAQLGVLILGLFVLGPPFGITGVASAVTVMAAVGIVILLWQARAFVDFSVVHLFGAPLIALLVGMLLAGSTMLLPGVLGSDWRTGVIKALVFTAAYGALLTALEGKRLLRMVVELRRLLSGRKAPVDAC